MHEANQAAPLTVADALQVLRLDAYALVHAAEWQAQGVTFPAHLTPDPAKIGASLTRVAEVLEATFAGAALPAETAATLLKRASRLLGQLGDGVGLPRMKRSLPIQADAEALAIAIDNYLDEADPPAVPRDAGEDTHGS